MVHSNPNLLDDKRALLWYTEAMKIEAELLAPAGNEMALRAAVNNGADAVYLALERFGARAKAENFTLNTLPKAVRYAHLFGVKIYLAVNTLICQNEMAGVLEMVSRAKDCGVDAFIVQDIGLVRELLNAVPDIVLHASTQMGIHNIEGAHFAKALGIRRVVLSRETELNDIIAIKEGTGLEIEYFVHGALCVGFSGNCYLSSLVSGFSGNRGRCLQLCRKKFHVACEGVKKEGYYLSTKDICLLDRLGQLLDAGVDSFKIEGRMRSVEYVAETTRIYRKILDGAIPQSEDWEDLKLVYNRGDYCCGYLDGKDVIYPEMQGHKGKYVGKVCSVIDNKALIASQTALMPGDGVKFIRNKAEVGTALISGNPSTYSGRVCTGDSVHQTSSKKLSIEVSSQKRRLPVNAEVFVECGLPIRLRLTHKKATIVVEGEIAQSAVTAPIGDGMLEKAIKKTGNTDFEIVRLIVNNDGRSFITKGGLNALRRMAIDSLREKILSLYATAKIASCGTMQDIFIMSDAGRLILSDKLYKIESIAQLELLRRFEPEADIIVSPLQFKGSEFRSIFNMLGKRAILDLPILAGGRDLAVLKAFILDMDVSCVCANNPYGYHMGVPCVLPGYGMNILNGSNVEGVFVQSPEMSNVLNSNAYVYTFGRLPFMTFKHCPRNVLRGCKGCDERYSYALRDDKGVFLIRHYRIEDCYAQLLGEKPVLLDDELNEINHKRRLYDFCGCDLRMMEKVLRKEPLQHIHFNFNKKLV